MAILQDGNRSIRVATSAINPLQIGDRVEAIGIPVFDDGFLTLKLGQIRSLGAAAPITPLPVTWEDLASGKHSNDLVSIEGMVVTQVREQAQDVYIISAGKQVFSATVRHPFVYEWGIDKPPPQVPDHRHPKHGARDRRSHPRRWESIQRRRRFWNSIALRIGCRRDRCAHPCSRFHT